jgi:hypothetical protein
VTNNINVYVHHADTRNFNIDTIAQLALFQPLTTQILVQSQASTCGICGGQSDIWTGRSQVFQVSPVSVIQHYFIQE